METAVRDKANIEIDREVWKRAKVAAAIQDRTLASLVEQALLEYLKRANARP